METEGLFAPATVAAARHRYRAAGTAAETVVRELARSTAAADAEAHGEKADRRRTAQEAIFASLLEVQVGTREEFDEALADRDREVEILGSEHVTGVAWHDAQAADRVLAATFESEPDAAVATLRRQAFARLYREVV